MRKIFLCLLLNLAQVIFAGSEEFQLPEIDYDKLNFGSDDTFEIVTWNIQNFPKSEQTVTYAAGIISGIDPDLVALQEIKSDSAFFALVNLLNETNGSIDWSGFKANSDEWDQDLAFIYKAETVKVEQVYEIFNDNEDNYIFPRSPLVIKFRYQEIPIVAVNNHLKAMSGEENEIRRRLAIEKLKLYFEDNFHHDNLILLGDLNDHLTDPKQENVFQLFLDDSQNYRFADYFIAADTTADWSYPYWKYRGHIDHILISNELFDEFDSKSSDIKTITVDKYMQGGEDARYKYITDHRPVALKLKFHPVIIEKR